MVKIDAHQHFWQYHPVKDSWITSEMGVLQQDFGPSELQPLLSQHQIEGCVAVQAAETDAENKYLLSHAEQHDFIKGVVGWVDLYQSDLEDKLSDLQQFQKLKGFRNILQGASPPDMMLQPAFLKGLKKLRPYQFTYDILIYADQLKYVPALVSKFPDQPFVVDHLAKPAIKKQDIKTWTKEMQEVALFENVYLKISGLITEADWQHWQKNDFKPYLDVAVNAFGPNRIMFGSDWPVCLLAGTYDQVVDVVQDYFQFFSPNEQALFFGGNASRFYNLT